MRLKSYLPFYLGSDSMIVIMIVTNTNVHRFQIDTKRKSAKRLKRDIVIAGSDGRLKSTYTGRNTKIFNGLNFCILTDMTDPPKKRKVELEQILKANGGSVFQGPSAKEDIVCIADKKVVKVASLIKSGTANIIKPSWVLDAIRQAEIDAPQNVLIPFEPKHMFHIADTGETGIGDTVDTYGDSFARDVLAKDLKSCFGSMVSSLSSNFSAQDFMAQLEGHDQGLGDMKAWIFRGCLACFILPVQQSDFERMLMLRVCQHRYQFAGGAIADLNDSAGITHFVMVDENPETINKLRFKISRLKSSQLPHIVELNWISESWSEGTRLDEERYSV